MFPGILPQEQDGRDQHQRRKPHLPTVKTAAFDGGMFLFFSQIFHTL